MADRIELKIADDSRDLSEIFDIRHKVFVIEQKVDEREEYDEFEETSKHLMARIGDEMVGVARIRRVPNGIKLERFAVLNEHRGKGVGAALVEYALELTRGYDNVYLHAQIQVVDFYERFGFVKEGEEFEEAGIRHYKMILK